MFVEWFQKASFRRSFLYSGHVGTAHIALSGGSQQCENGVLKCNQIVNDSLYRRLTDSTNLFWESITSDKFAKSLTAFDNICSTKNIELSFDIDLYNEAIYFPEVEIVDYRNYSYIKIMFCLGAFIRVKQYPITYNIFEAIEDSHILLSEVAALSCALELSAEPIVADAIVMFTEGSAGYFFHEIVGHLLENDNLQAWPRGYLLPGDSVATGTLVVSDDPRSACGDYANFGEYDDKANYLRKVDLIKSGKVAGLLSDSLIIGEYEKYSSGGNARCEAYFHKPIPRMMHTIVYLADHKNNLSKCEVEKYFEVTEVRSGFVSPVDGVFSLSATGYYVKQNERVAYLPNILITGNLMRALRMITAIESDARTNLAYCRKQGQTVFVGITAPTICIDELSVRGVQYAL